MNIHILIYIPVKKNLANWKDFPIGTRCNIHTPLLLTESDSRKVFSTRATLQVAAILIGKWVLRVLGHRVIISLIFITTDASGLL